MVDFVHSSVNVRNLPDGGMSFDLPYGPSLVWMPWPTNVNKPSFSLHANYETIFVHGKYHLQPRRSLCYGESFRYSGTDHKLEPETPSDIAALMSATRQFYPVEQTNDVSMMCLANWYQTGYHCISQHYDKEGQSSNIKDVWCWVVGQTRKVIIRSRENIDPQKTMMLKLSIPEGIYVMQGAMFQSLYTHEIPREQETLFRKLTAIVPPQVLGMGKLHSADWLAYNPDFVRQYAPELYQNYLIWRNPRYSYTIRFFSK